MIYVLDEPSIGLHQRDNTKLINALQSLRDSGNSVLVVEHDKEMIESANTVVEIGPGAGVHGGEIVQMNSPQNLDPNKSITASYINGDKEIEMPKSRRNGNGKTIKLEGATGNNLKNVTLELPLGFFAVLAVSLVVENHH